jgi:steroid delta-isomerase-like uncharacterized protein
MSTTDNVNLVRRWFEEVWNQGRMETVHELLDPHARGMGQGGGGTEISGPKDFVVFAKRLLGAFPDMNFTIDDAFGDGNKVVARWSATMTHTGPDLGFAATNREAHVTGITIVQIENGKIVAGWDNWDQLAMFRQLGVIPEAQESQLTLIEPKDSAQGASS